MLKSILNLDGVQQLNKNTQKQINGGTGTVPHIDNPDDFSYIDDSPADCKAPFKVNKYGRCVLDYSFF